MPTWDIASTHPSGSKPALAHTPSKRRAQQLRSAHRELDGADSDTTAPAPAYPSSDTPFPRKSTSDEELRLHDPGQGEDAALAQRTVRRKKSSFDLRDLFLAGGPERIAASVAASDRDS